ncbi:hypothetical protein SCLCIDRAFT_46549, partial [Scleroderma citrinum Foug A]
LCVVCLSRHPHHIVNCMEDLTWNKKHHTFAIHIAKSLYTCDHSHRVCTKWQREGGCQEQHSVLHLCS